MKTILKIMELIHEKYEVEEKDLIDKFGENNYRKFSQFCFGGNHPFAKEFGGVVNLTQDGVREYHKLKFEKQQETYKIITIVITAILAYATLSYAYVIYQDFQFRNTPYLTMKKFDYDIVYQDNQTITVDPFILLKNVGYVPLNYTIVRFDIEINGDIVNKTFENTGGIIYPQQNNNFYHGYVYLSRIENFNGKIFLTIDYAKLSDKGIYRLSEEIRFYPNKYFINNPKLEKIR